MREAPDALRESQPDVSWSRGGFTHSLEEKPFVSRVPCPASEHPRRAAVAGQVSVSTAVPLTERQSPKERCRGSARPEPRVGDGARWHKPVSVGLAAGSVQHGENAVPLPAFA